ncbi:MAG: hypothetical protein AAB409_07655 [Gemmatimonadota bacterium]
MSDGPPGESRTVTVPDGTRWDARVLAGGPASPYLAAKVARPLVEFTCRDAPAAPRRYAPLPVASLAALGEAELAALLSRSRVY